jgi:hypothetical protein
LKIVELIHDFDHLTIPSNLDLWIAAEHSGSTRKIRVYADENGTFSSSDFIRNLNSRPDTYELFKQLISNAAAYFKDL